MSRKNIDSLGINYTTSRENKTANHLEFVRISVRHQKTVDIELVVRMEDTTSNRRLGSLNFNLPLSLSLSCLKWREARGRVTEAHTHIDFALFVDVVR